ncbi:muscle-specific protein 20-like isoform X1 [Amphibalanus amphitrite]|uniref:muscle-specific protein 20-like isoform X1 n=1 Tax=Amphibalanus amphitrite TaxID=1232801 RepID=UPI001C924034|nr:muscle-specific protein 20-like isoform X1 [Amphibalanus amphitrite]
MPRVGKAGHRDPALELEIQRWIEAVTGETWPSDAEYGAVLRDGQVLCRLMNKLSPGAIKKINTSGAAFKFVENINNVQQAIKKYGVPDLDLFQTPDLFEKKDIPAVTNAIYALGRQTYHHPEWKGPWLGPKPGEE